MPRLVPLEISVFERLHEDFVFEDSADADQVPVIELGSPLALSGSARSRSADHEYEFLLYNRHI